MSNPTTPYLFRVCYSDTDAAGFVHHARYLEMFERSRTEWLHTMGLSPATMVKEFGIELLDDYLNRSRMFRDKQVKNSNL